MTSWGDRWCLRYASRACVALRADWHNECHHAVLQKHQYEWDRRGHRARARRGTRARDAKLITGIVSFAYLEVGMS